jgi:multiple sugar transport system substrate-binding protein
MLAYDAVAAAWQPKNIGLRPKIPTWNQVETVVFSELSAMLTGGQSPEDTMRACVSGIDLATKGGSSAV